MDYKMWVLLNVVKPISHKTQHEMFEKSSMDKKALWTIESELSKCISKKLDMKNLNLERRERTNANKGLISLLICAK
jgi:hypothetical protein